MLVKQFANTHSLIVDELPLCQGDSVIDVAVVNCSFHGFEIKSDWDTLERLPRQSASYEQTMDYMWIVVGPKRAEKIFDVVPAWWGIYVAQPMKNENDVKLKLLRKAKKNKLVRKEAVAQFLWKEEALMGLKLLGYEAGLKTQKKSVLHGKLAEYSNKTELSDFVREMLKARTTRQVAWRSDALQKLGGDLCLLSSTQLHCPAL